MKPGDEVVQLTVFPELGSAYHVVATAAMQLEEPTSPHWIVVQLVRGEGEHSDHNHAVRPLRARDIEHGALDSRAVFAFGHVIESASSIEERCIAAVGRKL